MAPRPIVDLTPLERSEELDRPVELLTRAAESVLPAGRTRELLRGDPLGHPAHPMLTDLPIGFWTSAFVLDLVAPRQGRVAARRLVAWGVLSTIPTIVTGLHDWHEMDDTAKKRVGVVHAAANATATLLYLKSYGARRRGRHLRGVLWGLAGAGAATAGGLLGGHLSFGSSSAGVADGAGAGTADPTDPTPATDTVGREAEGTARAVRPAAAAGGGADGAADATVSGTSDDDRQPADAGATGTWGDTGAPVRELEPRDRPEPRPGVTPARRTG